MRLHIEVSARREMEVVSWIPLCSWCISVPVLTTQNMMCWQSRSSLAEHEIIFWRNKTWFTGEAERDFRSKRLISGEREQMTNQYLQTKRNKYCFKILEMLHRHLCGICPIFSCVGHNRSHGWRALGPGDRHRQEHCMLCPKTCYLVCIYRFSFSHS